MEEIEQNIGYTFKNKELLHQAMTHTSYANERGIQSNEKLEFMGDSILQYVSSDYLYSHYTKLSEGELSKTRATVVCEKSLYVVAKKHNFSKYIRLGRTEAYSGGREKPTILADSVEAIIAAIYFDGGIEPARKFIIDNLKDAMEEASKHVGMKDYKSLLQETLQAKGETVIEYKLINETGPDHDKTFEIEVVSNGVVLASGTGKNKKSAEMQAAQRALEKMKNEEK